MQRQPFSFAEQNVEFVCRGLHIRPEWIDLLCIIKEWRKWSSLGISGRKWDKNQRRKGEERERKREEKWWLKSSQNTNPMIAVCGFFMETSQETTFSTWVDKTQKRNCLYSPRSWRQRVNEDISLQGLPEIMGSLLDSHRLWNWGDGNQV